MNKKHCPLDPIPSTLASAALPELTTIMSKIINCSLTEAVAVVPESLKSAVIRPSYKNNELDPDELSSYRPISNLSVGEAHKSFLGLMRDSAKCKWFGLDHSSGTVNSHTAKSRRTGETA
eukprot:sb/3476158/